MPSPAHLHRAILPPYLARSVPAQHSAGRARTWTRARLPSAPEQDPAAGLAHRQRVAARRGGGGQGDEAALADPVAHRHDRASVAPLRPLVGMHPAAAPAGACSWARARSRAARPARRSPRLRVRCRAPPQRASSSSRSRSCRRTRSLQPLISPTPRGAPRPRRGRRSRAASGAPAPGGRRAATRATAATCPARGRLGRREHEQDEVDRLTVLRPPFHAAPGAAHQHDGPGDEQRARVRDGDAAPHAGGAQALAHQQRGAERLRAPRSTGPLRLARQLAEDGVTAAGLEIRDEVREVRSRTEQDRHRSHDLPRGR